MIPSLYLPPTFYFFFWGALFVTTVDAAFLFYIFHMFIKWDQYKESKPENRLLYRLKNAETFEEWQSRARDLDR
ncbi:hypothetical protein EDC94DRAFT_116346 [Helicostylum pulchrum]|nr:hypothetical protein EDC94DRAFT_116346 [Helicostylum pulchrum]